MTGVMLISPCLLLILASSPAAQSLPTKVAVIQFRAAVERTKDGQKALADLQARYGPKAKEIEKQQAEVNALQEELRRTANTLNDDARLSLVEEIERKTRLVNHAQEDLRAESENDQNRILRQLAQRMMVVIQKYAKENGFALVQDISSPETSILWVDDAIDITDEIVALFDRSSAPGSPTSGTSSGT